MSEYVDKQTELWTDGLGNTLWRLEGGGYKLTTVMTVTPLTRENLDDLLGYLAKELGEYIE